jgi:N-acetylneuraminic acid mutarotase
MDLRRMLCFAGVFLGILFSTQAFGQGSWTTRAPMPTARGGFGVSVINGKVYVAGGQLHNSDTMTATLEVYDPISDTWTTKAPMPTARGAGVKAIAVNGVLYVIGGCTTNDCSGFVGTVEAYNPVSNSWTTKAPMPTARRSFGIDAVNGMVYAVGGLQGPGSSGISTNEAYDPAANTWSTKRPMPTPRGQVGAAVFNGLLYAIGGWNPSSGNVFTVEAYDPSTDTWITKASIPERGGNTTAATIDGTIYVPGQGPGNNDLLSYDPIADAWDFQAPMPTLANVSQAAEANGVLYAVGGDSTDQVNQAFTPTIGCPTATLSQRRLTVSDIF